MNDFLDILFFRFVAFFRKLPRLETKIPPSLRRAAETGSARAAAAALSSLGPPL